MPLSRVPDVAAIRSVAQGLLDAGDGPLPRFDELAQSTERLRAHFRVLLPAVELLARRGGDGSRPALETVAAVRQALAAGPGVGLVSAIQHALSLAREARALCCHYETLSGETEREPA